MAGITPTTPNRKGRRATAAAIAPVKPAIDASAERAAIERDPAIVDPPVVDPVVTDPVTPPVDASVDAAVLPEPTLVAEPGVPQPIVTASPILAVEPAAIDVVQADAAADRVAAGIDPAPDYDGPHPAAAGQPTLTIEGSDADRAAQILAAGGWGSRVLDTGTQFDSVRIGESRPAISVFSTKEILAELQLRIDREPHLVADVRDLWFDNEPAGRPLSWTPPVDAVGTVTVIEIVGPPQGRRRAGMSFGPHAQRFLASTMVESEIAALRADPLLAVSVSEVPEADAFAAVYG